MNKSSKTEKFSMRAIADKFNGVVRDSEDEDYEYDEGELYDEFDEYSAKLRLDVCMMNDELAYYAEIVDPDEELPISPVLEIVSSYHSLWFFPANIFSICKGTKEIKCGDSLCYADYMRNVDPKFKRTFHIIKPARAILEGYTRYVGWFEGDYELVSTEGVTQLLARFSQLGPMDSAIESSKVIEVYNFLNFARYFDWHNDLSFVTADMKSALLENFDKGVFITNALMLKESLEKIKADQEAKLKSKSTETPKGRKPAVVEKDEELSDEDFA